jgi:ribonuclease R
VDLPDDYYRYEESHMRLFGRRTRRIFALGDLVKVKVAHVDIRRRHVNLVLVEEEEGAKGEQGKREKGEKGNKF